ncbi:MAG TPA: TetR/AcrR family transcriptional regulator [Syntrophomonadaceae bacterium]|nr:TetR/AcrR family transcriptional regulator [Syntrophomonadaceae bacterium]
MTNHLSKPTTKERIMQAAVSIIAEEGFQSATTRKIAARAEVNVAAINYHFGSKEAVINEALKTVTDALRDTFEHLKKDGDPKVKLALFIDNYTDIVFKYPDILKNMVNHAINHKPLDRHTKYVAFIKSEGIEMVRQTIAEIDPSQDDSTLYLKTLHLVSSLSFPFLIGEFAKDVMGVDLYNEEIREMHTKILLENVCRKE